MTTAKPTRPYRFTAELALGVRPVELIFPPLTTSFETEVVKPYNGPEVIIGQRHEGVRPGRYSGVTAKCAVEEFGLRPEMVEEGKTYTIDIGESPR